MNNNTKLKLLGVISFISILLIVFFVIYFLSKINPNINNELTNEANNELSISYSESYITPKKDSLYVYNSYNYAKGIETSKHYKDEITIELSNNILQTKSVFDDFSELDTLIKFNSDNVEMLGISNVNTRESMIDNYKIAPSNNVFIPNSDKILLSYPIKTGTTWRNSENSVSAITNTYSIVDLPMGNFSSIEVTTKYDDGKIIKDYFVKNLGYVKSIISEPNGEAEVIYLQSVDDMSILSKTQLKSYDAISNTSRLIPIDNLISTNPTYINILEQMLKYKETDLSTSLIGENVHVNSANIDRDKNIVTVDFNNNPLEGSTHNINAEIGIIDAIATTIANFYNINYVKLTYNNGELINDGTINFSSPIFIELN